MEKIARLAAKYIKSRPVIEECLALDLINYSKLARRISSEIRAKNIDAVIAACRRHAYSVRKAGMRESPLSVIKTSRKSIEISGKKARVTLTVGESQLTSVLNALS